MAGHTKGPWVIWDEEDSSPSIFAVSPKTKIEPGSIRGYRAQIAQIDEDWDGNLAKGEKLANARLIAAAPELLDASKRLLEHYSERLPGHMIEEFRAALAKAEGTR